jgi:mono/diheme cytochrome c family protein
MGPPRQIWTFLALLATPAAAQQIAFNQSIRPILSDHCFTCHGPDAANRQANLRLDLSNGARGHESEILRRIASTNNAERMPPPYSGKPRLTAGEIDLVRQWIAQGTPWQPFW